MSKLVIEGGNRLSGEIDIQGAKNSALPILASTILSKGESVIHNCPDLSDIDITIKILTYLGCRVKKDKDVLTIDSSKINRCDIPDNLMREMRSSIIFLGAVLSRTGSAKLSFPGGCELGPRPIDLHLKALRNMGVSINDEGGTIDCNIKSGLKGARIALSFPSVGATENIILAAVLAEGITVITNAAREPEIVDLAEYLISCGAKISGAGEGSITIEGVSKLSASEHYVIPDRIAAVTFMSAAAVTDGEIKLNNIIPSHLDQIIPMFEEAGCDIRYEVDNLKKCLVLKSAGDLQAIKIVRTMPYPGFPTDAQAPIMAMTTVSKGTSVFVENIFESRYKHVGELLRLGANIKVEGKVAVVEGVKKLSGAPINAPDLRGGAALIIAALAAYGTTTITNLNYIDRGYQFIEKDLRSLGANIRRV